MTITDLLMSHECTWCEHGIEWNARKHRWEDQNKESFCPAKMYFPFVHQAKEDDDSDVGGDISDYS
jgi:hypothetical protein